MKKEAFKASDNIYVIPLSMPDKPESEWEEAEIKNIAYHAAMSVIDLFDTLVNEKEYENINK